MRFRGWIWVISVVGLIAAAQVVSFWVTQNSQTVFYNSQFAFSLPVPVAIMYGVYVVIEFIIILHMINTFARQDNAEKWAWALIMAGSLSNIGERLLFGSVRDYILVLSGVFNAADAFIILGILLLLLRPKRAVSTG